MYFEKSSKNAYLLMIFTLFGLAGMHRFYLGKYISGCFYLLTWGWFGFGTLYDFFTLKQQVREVNDKINEAIEEIIDERV